MYSLIEGTKLLFQWQIWMQKAKSKKLSTVPRSLIHRRDGARREINTATDLLDKYCDNLIIWCLCYQTQIFVPGIWHIGWSVTDSIMERKESRQNGDYICWEIQTRIENLEGWGGLWLEKKSSIDSCWQIWCNIPAWLVVTLSDTYCFAWSLASSETPLTASSRKL